MSIQDLVSRIETARSNLQEARNQLSSSRAINAADITSHQNPGTPIDCTPEPRPGRTETILTGALAGTGVGILTGAAIGAPAAGVGAAPGAIAGGFIGAGVGAVGGYFKYEIDSIPDEGCPTLPPTE